jgi:hypothetical protein
VFVLDCLRKWLGLSWAVEQILPHHSRIYDALIVYRSGTRIWYEYKEMYYLFAALHIRDCEDCEKLLTSYDHEPEFVFNYFWDTFDVNPTTGEWDDEWTKNEYIRRKKIWEDFIEARLKQEKL